MMNLILSITGCSHAPNCAAAEIQAMLNELVDKLDDVVDVDDGEIEFPVSVTSMPNSAHWLVKW